ncbi:hypothetical protein K505DRAFT_321123 [Melanomma pulvis-pyrius CBS 109.77]|uniref:Uncharacterized protein n=1 Tax=Melanomma pulvis-pyrius CBS 109.77 TaxID=1314802 RepID=A0A6A6XSS3_9PLEO|nr:hypothetical protein K505DRAFT_321123 [Melanomma pulvis-pyrius CBS 109.77]
MAATEFDTQPVQDLNAQTEDMDMENAMPADDTLIPEHKSGVYVDPDAPDQSGRFGKKDLVHMSLVESGVRKKGTFTVGKGRLHASKAFFEYQLVDGDGRLYKNGAWIREKDLRLEKKRG